MIQKTQLIFLGGPGSGKGTLAGQFVEQFGYKHLSTGDLLRSEVRKGTELGIRVDEVMKRGHLVSDEIVIELLQANCNLSSGSYILDGFPRNHVQAEILERDFLKGSPYKAVYFEVPRPVLIQRLTARRVCGKCGAIYHMVNNPPPSTGICVQCGQRSIEHRKDDQETTILERLQVFEKTMQPVKEFYSKQGHLVELRAEQAANEVFKDAVKQLGLKK